MAESGKSPDMSPQNVGRLRREISDKIYSNLGNDADEIIDRTDEQKAYRHTQEPFFQRVARTAIDFRRRLIREAAKDLRYEYDSLTGVFTRERFAQKLYEEFDKAVNREEPLTLVLMDMNYLSRFNDEQGHDVGDRALRKVGQILSDDSHSTDTTGQLLSPSYAGRGERGDEFEACLPNCDDRGTIIWWNRRIPKFQQKYDDLNGQDISIAAGYVVLDPERFKNATKQEKLDYIEEQRRRADAALYLAKVRSKRGGLRGQALVNANELDNLPAQEAEELRIYRETPKKK